MDEDDNALSQALAPLLSASAKAQCDIMIAVLSTLIAKKILTPDDVREGILDRLENVLETPPPDDAVGDQLELNLLRVLVSRIRHALFDEDDPENST